MQPMQAFTAASDPYQTSRCAAAGNLGIGIVSTGVHGNAANYNNFTNNYMHGEPSMTRIVFNGNNARNDFHCGTDNFQQSCIAAGELLDNSANYQLNFVNSNGNMRYMRQQMNPSFLGDQMQRCYVQRTQGQQGRFVRVQQGNKMRPTSYRNFNNNQQRQKQNRRFITKGFNNYKNPSNIGTTPTDGYFEENTSGGGSSSPTRFAQPHAKTLDKETRKVPSGGRSKLDTQTSAGSGSNDAQSSSSTMDSTNRSNNACTINGGTGKLLQPKMEYVNDHMHNLSYDDVSENSEGNDDADLRERLSRKIIKREPGELDSEDDEGEIRRQKEASNKRKSKKKHGGEDSAKKCKSSGPASSNNERDCQSKEMKRSHSSQKSGRKESGKGSYSPPYSCHDNRCSPGHKNNKGMTECMAQKSHCPAGPNSYGSTYSDCTAQNFCCQETEVVELKDKISAMKQSLRDAQDKLLEANVVGSKKALRMQEEISKLKKQLEESTKTEIDLKTSLRNVENELAVKSTELTKMKLLNEVEKQDKAKLNAEMSRTYKERLSIEVEKLRALFDVEVAKMQTFYMSSNVYGDETNIPFPDVSSDQNQINQHPLPTRSTGSSRSTEMNSASENRSHATSNVNGHHEIPFLHNYFDSSSHTVATTPFSLFENVLAYNSLIRHQQIYSHNMPSSSASGNGSENGNNVGMGNNCGSNSAM